MTEAEYEEIKQANRAVTQARYDLDALQSQLNALQYRYDSTVHTMGCAIALLLGVVTTLVYVLLKTT